MVFAYARSRQHCGFFLVFLTRTGARSQTTKRQGRRRLSLITQARRVFTAAQK